MEESPNGFSQETNSSEILPLLEGMENELESDKHPYLSEVGFIRPGIFRGTKRRVGETFTSTRHFKFPFRKISLKTKLILHL